LPEVLLVPHCNLDRGQTTNAVESQFYLK